MVLDALLPKKGSGALSTDPERQQYLIRLVDIDGPPIRWPLESRTKITRMRVTKV